MTKINILALMLAITSTLSATDLHDEAKPGRAAAPEVPAASPVVMEMERSAQQPDSFARDPGDKYYIAHIEKNSQTDELYIVHQPTKLGRLTRAEFDAGQAPYADPAADEAIKTFTLCDPDRGMLYTFHSRCGHISQSSITDRKKLRPTGLPTPTGLGLVDALCFDSHRQILFFGNYGGYLQSFDVKEGVKPLGKVDFGPPFGSLTLLEESQYLYVSYIYKNSVFVMAVDVSNPISMRPTRSKPSLLTDGATISMYSSHFPWKLLITNKQQTLVASYGDIIRFYDISDPATPIDLGNPVTFAGPNRPPDMSGDMIVHPETGILMVAFNAAVHLYDTSNPAAPLLLRSVDTGMHSSQLVLMGRSLLLVPDSEKVFPTDRPLDVVTSYDLTVLNGKHIMA